MRGICCNGGVCTAVLRFEPGLPVLLAGVRDEFLDRAWEPPARHWPAEPGLIGGRDLLAGGTWLAVAPERRRVSCVLNGIGRPAPAASRRSRGTLPLRAAAGDQLDREALPHLDPFRLLTAEPGRATLQNWDGADLTEQDLPPGLHFVVNSGRASELGGAAPIPDGREHERSRIAHFVQRFEDAGRPDPRPGQSMIAAWGAWLPLVDGDGLEQGDPRALIVRRVLADGRVWGSTSVSLVAVSQYGVRYDFTSEPGNPAGWYPVL